MLLTRAFGFTVRVATLFLLLSVEGSMAGRSSELNEAIEKFDRLVREGKSQEAIPWVERAIQLAEIELDAKDPRWAGVLTHQLGAIYAELGRYAEAEPALERSLSLTKEARGNKHLDLTPILYNLAVVKIKQGRYADAEDRLSEALRLSELLLVPGDPDIAKFGELLAAVYEQLGRQAEAAAVRKRIGDSPGVVSIVSTTPGVLVKRASVYVRQGRLNEAVSVLESALAALESTSSTSHLDLTKVQHRLADILIKLGRYNDAENYLRRAIELRESALRPDHEDLAPLLESLAVLYSQHGRRRESEALYERALAIRPTDPGEDGAGTVSTLNALAAIKSRDGPIDEARDLYLRALEISRDNDRVGDRVVAASLSGLASVYAEIARRWDAVGQYDTAERLTQAAEQLFKRSLSMLTAVLGPDRVDPTLGVITNDLGWLYINAGRTDEGESFAQRSLEIKEEIYGPTHPFVAQAYSNLAALFLEQSRYDDALSYSRKGVSVMSRRITDTRRGMDTLQELEEYKQIFGTHIDVVAAISARNPPDPQSITDEAFRSSQMALATGTQVAVTDMVERLDAGNNTALATLLRERQDTARMFLQIDAKLIDSYARLPGERIPARESALREQRNALATRLNQIDTIVARDFPGYANLTALRPIPLAEAQQALQPDEALLTYQVSTRGVRLWVVRQHDTRLHYIRTRPTETSEAVTQIRSSLGGSDEPTLKNLTPFDIHAAYNLYRTLIMPVRDWFECGVTVRIGNSCTKDLLDGVRHILVVADGVLQSLPFSLLVSEEPSGDINDLRVYKEVPWLAKQYAITILPSVASLPALRQRTALSTASKPFVGFGDPSLKGRYGTKRITTDAPSAGRVDYRLESLRRLSPLPDTAVELFKIANELSAQPAKAVFLQRDATETRLRRMSRQGLLENYRIVAFATHGLVAGQISDTMEPGLVMTPPRQVSDEDDGFLAASEVAELKLNADWVVLSACNTASTDGTPGAEGLSGLAKAFLYAGSRALLVSHWRVSSDATVALTTEMFRLAAAKGIRKSEALRRSMLKVMRDDGNPHFAHPLFWAPFVVVGEGGPLH